MKTKLVRQLVTSVASWATLLGFALVFKNPARSFSIGWVLLIALSVAALSMNLLYDVKEYRANRSRIFKEDKNDKSKKDREIQRYMIAWIKSGGRTTILTRDMSWLNEEARDELTKKAKTGDLTILAQEPGKGDIQDLARQGAQVYYYGMKGFVPQSRFTIINDSKLGACVLIGRPDNQNHVIEKYSDPMSPVVSLAKDLAGYVKKSQKKPKKKSLRFNKDSGSTGDARHVSGDGMPEPLDSAACEASELTQPTSDTPASEQ